MSDTFNKVAKPSKKLTPRDEQVAEIEDRLASEARLKFVEGIVFATLMQSPQLADFTVISDIDPEGNFTGEVRLMLNGEWYRVKVEPDP